MSRKVKTFRKNMFIQRYEKNKPKNDFEYKKTKKMIILEEKFGKDIYTLLTNSIGSHGVSRAATELGIHRKTLRKYIEKLNIDVSYFSFPGVEDLYKLEFRPYTKDTLLMIKEELDKGNDFETIAFIIKRNPYQIQELIKKVYRRKNLRTYRDIVKNKDDQFYFEIC